MEIIFILIYIVGVFITAGILVDELNKGYEPELPDYAFAVYFGIAWPILAIVIILGWLLRSVMRL